MSSLKPIGVSPDGSTLLLGRSSGSRGPSFRLGIDETLVAALEEAHAARAAAKKAKDQLELPPPVPTRVESKLTVREVQNLLRQGRTVAAIAKRAGVDPQWVERWESPIVWERAGMAARARRCHLMKARGGISRVPLGEAVTANLKDRGVKLDARAFEAAWDSTKKARSSRWAVTFTFTSKGREQTARWEFDPESGEVHGLDKLANELGWIAPPRKRTRA